MHVLREDDPAPSSTSMAAVHAGADDGAAALAHIADARRAHQQQRDSRGLRRPLLMPLLPHDLLPLCLQLSAEYDPRDYGAVGDGVTDDTPAFLHALAALNVTGGVLRIPSGTFRITGPLVAQSPCAVSLLGLGLSSTLLWDFNGNLITIPATSSTHFTVRDLAFLSTDAVTDDTATALTVHDAQQSLIDHIVVRPAQRDCSAGTASGINLLGVADSVSIRDSQMWCLRGTGVKIGYGSEVRIHGGRIIGRALRNDSSIGIHCTGNNGGVHVTSTDVISLGTGMQLDDSVAGTSVRHRRSGVLHGSTRSAV
jgi:hypothetical protein